MKTTSAALPSPYLDALADAFFGDGFRDTSPAAQAAFVPKLAVFTAAVGVHLIAYAGVGLIRRIHNHFDPPPPPAPPKPSPSLRGTPSPEDLSNLWDVDPRSLPTRLRIGSRLADLEPTLDSTFVFKDKRRKHHRIVARNPGMKGWLRKNAPEIAYSTAMHYKKLATRLRQLVGLDARIPLEWLLPGDTDGADRISALSPADQSAVAAAGRKLRALLADTPKYTHLVQTVEQKLGIMRLSTIRHIQPIKHTTRHGHRPRTKRQEIPEFSLVSQLPPTLQGESQSQNVQGAREAFGEREVQSIVHDGKTITMGILRSTAFWEAIRRILGETDPSPATRRLQSDIRRWLNAPLLARHNRRR